MVNYHFNHFSNSCFIKPHASKIWLADWEENALEDNKATWKKHGYKDTHWSLMSYKTVNINFTIKNTLVSRINIICDPQWFTHFLLYTKLS